MGLQRLWQVGKGLCTTIDLAGRPLEVRCTPRATRALTGRDALLVAEMGLVFTCMAQKEVRFHDCAPDQDIVAVTDKLAVAKSAMVAGHCDTSEPAAGTQGDAAMAKLHNFAPRWLSVDFRDGKWVGDYGL